MFDNTYSNLKNLKEFWGDREMAQQLRAFNPQYPHDGSQLCITGYDIIFQHVGIQVEHSYINHK